MGLTQEKKKIRELSYFNLERSFSSNIIFRQMNIDACPFPIQEFTNFFLFSRKNNEELRLELQ